jgi:hypothetical protein
VDSDVDSVSNRSSTFESRRKVPVKTTKQIRNRAGDAQPGKRTSHQGGLAASGAQLTSDIGGRPRRGHFGCVERVDSKGLSGWLVNAAALDEEQSLTIELDGVEIFSVTANVLRSDVSELLGGPTYCGFELAWRDIRPQGRLKVGKARVGKLVALSAEGATLPLAVDTDCESLYERAVAYAGRLALVMGTDQFAEQVLLDRDLIAEEFDAKFYAAMYQAAAEAAQSAIDHFMETGWQLGFDPNADFSCTYYLDKNPDVRDGGINPFLHYLRSGRSEGRLPRQPGGFRLAVLRDQLSLVDLAKSWRRSDSMRSLSGGALLKRLEERLRDKKPSGLVVSFSHDDYTANVGGVQHCIGFEQRAFNDADCVYLHLSPWQAAPTLFPGRDPGQVPLRVLCDGEEVGYAIGRDVVGLVSALRAGPLAALPSWLVVHALHGHATEVVMQMHDALQPKCAYFWLHDYFTVCTGYNLLRNQVAFCDAPPATSAGCAICVYGGSRADHLARMGALFSKVRFTAVAPSQHTADQWRKSTDLPVADLIVAPHCHIEPEGQRLDSQFATSALSEEQTELRPIRVAFLGHPVAHKGWPVFREMVRQFCGTGGYEFWHLGTAGDAKLPVVFNEVKVTPENPDAMIRAIDAANIDVVLQWSICPETFGITARECVAAGAFLLTSRGSGAIAAYVETTGGGKVLDDEAALHTYLMGDELREVVSERVRTGVPIGSLKWGRLTADLAGVNSMPAAQTTSIANKKG